MVKIIFKKIGLIFFGIFLALLILEVTLRIGGFIYDTKQHYGYNTPNKTENTYRILTLGESTTAKGYVKGHSSWPEELEIILNERSKDIKFRVFNEGMAGRYTSDILSKLEDNLDKYNPHMVIAMMGTNDEGLYIKHNKTFGGKLRLLFRDYRVYKLTEYIIEALKYKITNDKGYIREEIDKDAIIEQQYKENQINAANLAALSIKSKIEDKVEEMAKKAIEANPGDYIPYLMLGNLYNELNRLEEGIKMYTKYLEIRQKYDEHAAIQLARLYKRLGKISEAYDILKLVIFSNPDKIEEVIWVGEMYEELNKSDEAIDLFWITIEKNNNNYAAYSELAWYYLNNNMTQEAEEIFDRALKANPYTLSLTYRNVGYIYQRKGQFEKADEMFNRVAELRRDYYDPITLENYHKLYEILNERGIILIAMQYPTLDADGLKDMFRGDEEIIFISNEENFKRVLASSPYEEYFVDRVRGSFGHTTANGSILIAENVADVILNNVIV